jgi:hypothetical protein
MALLLGCCAAMAQAKNPADLPEPSAGASADRREAVGFLQKPGQLVLSSLGILSLVLLRARVEG